MILSTENLLIIGFIIISLFFIKGPSFSYYWFIINGIWIHIYLDGLIGVFQQHKWLFQQYSNLDARYPNREPTVLGVSAIEIFFMGPICIWIATKLRRHENTIFTLILITFVSAVQIMGTVMFIVNAWLRDFVDVCDGSCFSFTSSNIFYFWTIFILVNPIWIVVPIQQIISNYRVTMQNYSPLKIKQK